ncbi:sigma 54-interacting transcriptional regulator [Neobacillus mesonae]|uniref:sigma 54-interacting transcriptional regulator n=1 Tax=Neobacillus mesonae TaxID=1193713 RepID=UPI000A024A09|nr:sigma 54-interacting transcriptional regulator [Neobacillus mesonae]MED4203325.1 sigma 54-interacting transcriptional regulator [Neobacillus mesonae]
MVEKELIVISIQDEYLSMISKQMTEIAGDLIRIRPISINNLSREEISKDDIVLLGANFIFPLVRPFLPEGVKYVTAGRGFNYVNMAKLLSSPKGKNVLVVNDTKQTTDETVQALQEAVFEHNYYSYNLDSEIPLDIDFVITPGEIQLVPEGRFEVIDIGYRVLSLETVFEVFTLLGLNCSQIFLTNRYMKSLVALSNESSHSKITPAYFSKWGIGRGTAKYYFEDVIANSKVMQDTLYIARKLAKMSDPVHIFGETGTGKRMLAQAIHNDSFNKEGPYLSINCSGRPREVLERELYGSELDGQITPGLFEMANGGTICIEDIDELPLALQGRLLQTLEEGQVIRIGGHHPVSVRVRVITISNYDLSLLVDEGKFRKDLFYYLAVLPCKTPSLSERMEDFESLIHTYLESHLFHEKLVIPPDMINLLKYYSWPGNVRELFNAVSYMACLVEKELTLESLPFYIKGRLQKYVKESMPLPDITESELNDLIFNIEEHGFLEESLAILEVFEQGKKQCESYGRTVVKGRLRENGFTLSEQQLRLRLEVLNQLELLNVRQGRSGTTISRKGEVFLQMIRLNGISTVGNYGNVEND